MLDHVTIRVSDSAASERFYDVVLGTLGLQPRRSELGSEWGDFSMSEATAEKPVTRHLHIAFGAASRELVDAFWRAGTEAGYRDDGAPGPRPEYGDDYYGGFLLDPDGNSAEAVHHETAAQRMIDHLWVGVGDVGAARRFYEQAAPFTGFSLTSVLPERVHFGGANASFGLVDRTPTEQLHLAFGANDNETVDAFHEAMTKAGYPDNGPPGERTIYHPGYYGAFVLDPDGNNIEVVNHNRS